MMDIDQSQRRDIDNIQNDKISLVIDEYNTLSSPLYFNLLNYVVDGYNWVVNNNRFIKYNLVENDKLVFHIDKVDELLEKNIINIKIEFDIVNGNNNFILNGINLIHDDVIKSKSFNVFMNRSHFSFNCKLFDYDNLDFIVDGKGFNVELLFNGNKSNSALVLENINIVFEFTDKLQNEKDTIYNRIENDIVDWIYPVGSIYMNINPVSPDLIFGGEWVRIKDKFLLSAGDNYNAGDEGGEATHTLTENEMPSHTHIQDSHNHTQNAHNHTQNPHSHTIGSLARYVITGKGNAAVGNGYGNVQNYKTGSTTATNKEATATNNPQTATNQNTGGGQAHNNMPPYLVVNIWRRIR